MVVVVEQERPYCAGRRGRTRYLLCSWQWSLIHPVLGTVGESQQGSPTVSSSPTITATNHRDCTPSQGVEDVDNLRKASRANLYYIYLFSFQTRITINDIAKVPRTQNYLCETGSISGMILFKGIIHKDEGRSRGSLTCGPRSP